MKSIAVLMSTYNGEQWLSQQLDSLICQKDVSLHIFIRDDGSADKTIDILNNYANQNCNIHFINQENRVNIGPAESFMYLIDYMKRNLQKFDYYALCDQDDVWLEDKLARAVNMLKDISGPVLYFSKKTIVDENLKVLNQEDYIPYRDCILHSLKGSNAYGCTFVFNLELLNTIKKLPCGYHDAWIFRIAVWCGFHVIYDMESRILYRQHGNNNVGAKKKQNIIRIIFDCNKWKEQLERFLCINMDEQIIMQQAVYDNYKDSYPCENMELLKQVVGYRHDFLCRIRLMNNKIFRKYGWKDNLKWKMRILENRL